MKWSWITFLRGGFAHFAKTTKWPPTGGYPVPFSPRHNTCLVLLLTLIVNVNVFPTDNISCSISFPLFQLTVIGVSCVNCPLPDYSDDLWDHATCTTHNSYYQIITNIYLQRPRDIFFSLCHPRHLFVLNFLTHAKDRIALKNSIQLIHICDYLIIWVMSCTGCMVS